MARSASFQPDRLRTLAQPKAARTANRQRAENQEAVRGAQQAQDRNLGEQGEWQGHALDQAAVPQRPGAQGEDERHQEEADPYSGSLAAADERQPRERHGSQAQIADEPKRLVGAPVGIRIRREATPEGVVVRREKQEGDVDPSVPLGLLKVGLSRSQDAEHRPYRRQDDQGGDDSRQRPIPQQPQCGPPRPDQGPQGQRYQRERELEGEMPITEGVEGIADAHPQGVLPAPLSPDPFEIEERQRNELCRNQIELLDGLIEMLGKVREYETGQERSASVTRDLSSQQIRTQSSKPEGQHDAAVIGGARPPCDVDGQAGDHVEDRMDVERHVHACWVKQILRRVGMLVEIQQARFPPPEVPVVLPQIDPAGGNMGPKAKSQRIGHRQGHEQIHGRHESCTVELPGDGRLRGLGRAVGTVVVGHRVERVFLKTP